LYQVVPLEIDAPGADLLRLRHIKRQTISNDQQRCVMIRVAFIVYFPPSCT
jgi:hypothetical protein